VFVRTVALDVTDGQVAGPRVGREEEFIRERMQLHRNPKGPITLQHHGGYNAKTQKYSPASSLIQFRNIYVKELK